MKTRIILTSLVVSSIFVGLTGCKTNKRSAASSTKVDFVEYDMPNGLHVILSKDNSTPVTAISVMYHVGSKDDPKNRTGFAHFFEHLLFEGSENLKRGDFDKYLDNAGGENNAYTAQDITYYHEVVPSNQLELALWLESERMMHAKVEKVGIETQRQVVKEERRMRYDNQPYGRLMEEIFKRAYTVHPYQHTPIGSMSDLDAAEENDYVNFYKTFYVPNNATLSISGDIDYAKTKELIQKYFVDIPKGKEVSRVVAVEPQKTAEVRDVVYDNIQLPALVTAYHIPASGTEDCYAIEMLSKVFSDGESSRLYKALVNDEKCVQAGAFPYVTEHPGLLVSYGIANMGVKVEEIESVLDREVAVLQNELISEKEFQKIRNMIENDFVWSYTTAYKKAESLAQYHTYYKNAGMINTELNKYLAVTREDIQRVAKKYLVKSNRVLLHWLPKQ